MDFRKSINGLAVICGDGDGLEPFVGIGVCVLQPAAGQTQSAVLGQERLYLVVQAAGGAEVCLAPPVGRGRHRVIGATVSLVVVGDRYYATEPASCLTVPPYQLTNRV